MKVPCWALGVGGRSDDAEEEQEGKGPRCARATASWSSSSSHAAGACAVVVRWQGVSKKDAWFERAMACAPPPHSTSNERPPAYMSTRVRNSLPTQRSFPKHSITVQ